MTSAIDALDARLIRALAEAPRTGVLELARRLRVARGTAQSRLDKLQRRGVVTGFVVQGFRAGSSASRPGARPERNDQKKRAAANTTTLITCAIVMP